LIFFDSLKMDIYIINNLKGALTIKYKFKENVYFFLFINECDNLHNIYYIN